VVQVGLDSSSISSSLAGTVAKRRVQPGESLAMGDMRVATIVDNSLLVMRGEVSEASVREVHAGQQVR